MIVLTGCVGADTTHTNTDQVLDQRAVFRAITKHSFTLSAASVHVIANKAVSMCVEGQQAPIHIDVPISVANQDALGAGELRPPEMPVVPSYFALIELKQRCRQIKNRGVDFGRSDFAAIARAFGGAGHCVLSAEELTEALNTAQMADTFIVIAVEIEKGAYDGRI